MKDFLSSLTPEQRRQLADDLKQFDQPQIPVQPPVTAPPKSGPGWIGAIILAVIIFLGVRALDTPAPVQPIPQQIRR